MQMVLSDMFLVSSLTLLWRYSSGECACLKSIADLAPPIVDLCLDTKSLIIEKTFGERKFSLSHSLYSLFPANPVLPDHLQFVEINVFTRSQCETYWPGSINDGHICIGEIGSAASCNGDSGGPLVVENRLVGITSWGILYCYTTHPAVYSRVAYFRQWIDQVIAQ